MIPNKIIAKNKNDLKMLIKTEMIMHGNFCSLNHIDTSLVTDMSYLFDESKFNGDISDWNVSNVTNMDSMFWFSQFNNDISKWDVSNVKNMSAMFNNSKFKGDISSWSVFKVINMNGIFINCDIDKPWWAIVDNDQRKIILDKYEFMQHLNTTLDNTNLKSHKKIKL